MSIHYPEEGLSALQAQLSEDQAARDARNSMSEESFRDWMVRPQVVANPSRTRLHNESAMASPAIIALKRAEDAMEELSVPTADTVDEDYL